VLFHRPANMALQRTRRPRFLKLQSSLGAHRSVQGHAGTGRSLRSLGSPLNAQLLGASRSTPLVRPLMLSLLLLFPASAARSGDGCGFPWTITALPAGGENFAIFLCGTVCRCTPHNRQVSVVGSEIRVTYTQGEFPDGCSCLTICYDFRDTVLVQQLFPGEYTVKVTLVDCGLATLVATGTVTLDPSAAIPALDLRGAMALALLLGLAAVWRLRT
jgi:hypothetical protein